MRAASCEGDQERSAETAELPQVDVVRGSRRIPLVKTGRGEKQENVSRLALWNM